MASATRAFPEGEVGEAAVIEANAPLLYLHSGHRAVTTGPGRALTIPARFRIGGPAIALDVDQDLEAAVPAG